MALTQGEWTPRTENGRLVLECDVIQTINEKDAYTLKTPAGQLDPSKPWILMVNTEADELDEAALAVDIWAGLADDFEITGDDGTVAATSGYEAVSAAIDDVKSVALALLVNPNYNGSKVQTALSGPVLGECNAGKAPYYAFNLDGGGALIAGTCHWVIIQ